MEEIISVNDQFYILASSSMADDRTLEAPHKRSQREILRLEHEPRTGPAYPAESDHPEEQALISMPLFAYDHASFLRLNLRRTIWLFEQSQCLPVIPGW